MSKKHHNEDAYALSCKAISFLTKAVQKKQDLLSKESQMEDKKILKEVKRFEQDVKNGKLFLPVSLCINLFQKMDKDYAERNVSSTGIGRLGCFLIDYILTHQELSVASQSLYKNNSKSLYRQFEWYNYAVGKIFDLAAQKKHMVLSKKVPLFIDDSRQKN